MSVELVVFLLVVALAAGWVDAVVGGGGLVQLPVLLLALPGAPPSAILATDKLSSISGTTASAVGFARNAGAELRVAVPAGVLGLAASGAGALTAGTVPATVFRPFVLVALLVVACVVILRPGIGTASGGGGRHAAAPRLAGVVVLVGVALPFYNGLVGPGTGAMILLALSVLLRMDFLTGSATAKVVNVGANLGALVVFAAQGHVFWLLGLGMGACNVLGARLGTRTALRRGSGFIRATLLCVVAALLVKLGVDQLG
ncbi:sulfite exporter TauE/SafE family protein [Nonomuraea sp. NPDC050556]|uniref:sulfite exporter TauE/SafE family protein n=1 Tax=Nonomuraea sp. NPDC050556 TaxID=3364369 RepID=UPI00378AAA2C